MTYSHVEICNCALQVIGAATITSLEGSSRESQACARFYPLLRRGVFRAVPWRCVAQRAALTELGATPSWGYAYAYRLPADYVRMIGFEDPDVEYHEVGQYLHTDESPADIEYVCDDPDWTHYSADLVRCLYLNLAYEIAFALAGEGAVKIAEAIKADLEKFFLPLVRFTNSVETGKRTFQSDTLTDLFQ